jgi:AcrR family transcriptional regulator
VKNGDADRKTLIADAAIDVLGRDGLRALTHRAVDTRAGLPQGTCSYHHRTRRSLLAAVLRRIADLDRADIAAASGAAPVGVAPVPAGAAPVGVAPVPAGVAPVGVATVPAGVAPALDRAIAVLQQWLGPGRIRTRARLVLMLDAEARRDLGAEADRLAGEFVAGATATLGSAERARLMVALLDGLTVDELVRGGDDAPPEPVLRARLAAVFTAIGALA